MIHNVTPKIITQNLKLSQDIFVRISLRPKGFDFRYIFEL